MDYPAVFQQTGFRFREWEGEVTFGLSSSALPLADQNVNLTIGSQKFRIGHQVAQTDPNFTGGGKYYYAFFSVNGGAYSPVYRKGNSAQADASALVSVMHSGVTTRSTTGSSTYITGTTGYIYRVAYGTGELNEVSVCYEYWSAGGTPVFILDFFLEINHGVAAVDDVIRVHIYESHLSLLTVADLEQGILDGNVIPFSGGYTLTPEITVGSGDITVSPIALQEPLVLNGDTAFGIETVPAIAPDVSVTSTAKRMLWVVAGSSMVQNALDFIALIEAEGWTVEVVYDTPHLSSFDMGDYSVLFIYGYYTTTEFDIVETDLQIPIITNQRVTAHSRLGLGSTTAASAVTWNIINRRVSDSRSPLSSYSMPSVTRTVLYDSQTNWDSQVNGTIHYNYYYTNYAWIAERISSNGYPRVYFEEPWARFSTSYDTLALNWLTQTHHPVDGIKYVQGADLTWSVVPEV